MARHNVFRDGKVHVMAERCSTCIFQPGNLMHLRRGRVKQMVESATADESTIVCHQTLEGDNACCRGFYELYPTPGLQMAERLGMIEEVKP